MDVGPEQVHPCDREVRRRIVGLLDELHDLAVGAEHGHARLTGIVDVREQELGGELIRRGGAFGLELRDEPVQTLLEHVVAQVHHEVVVAEEVAGDQHAMGEAERGVLGM